MTFFTNYFTSMDNYSANSRCVQNRNHYALTCVSMRIFIFYFILFFHFSKKQNIHSSFEFNEINHLSIEKFDMSRKTIKLHQLPLMISVRFRSLYVLTGNRNWTLIDLAFLN